MNLKELLFIVCLLSSFAGMPSEVKAEDKNEDGNIVAGGLLPVYKFGDKIYLLIAEELLGREFMITAQVDKGKGKHGELLESKGVFGLRAGKGANLDVYDVSVTDQATGNGFPGNLELKGLKCPQEVWTVDRRMGSGYLVEITEWLKEPGEWYRFDSSLRMSNFDKPVVSGISVSESGVCFRVRHCVHVSYKQGVVEMAAENGVGYVDISVAFKLLPKDYGKTVIMFPDSPFRIQDAVDYGISPWGCVKCNRGIHWEMSKEIPLKISIDGSVPEVYVRGLRNVIVKIMQKIGIADCIVLEQKKQSLDAMDQCGMGFMGDEGELFAECVAHPATGQLLFGRMVVGEKDMNEKIVRWQLNNMERGDDGRCRISTKEHAYEQCLEEEIMQGVLILLGIDAEKLGNGTVKDDVWNSLRYVYAGDRSGLIKEEMSASDGRLWEKFVLLRRERKELLEQLGFESVLDYYRQSLVLGEEDYISVFKRGEWKKGDIECLLKLMEADASGYFATDYIRKNMLGRNARETHESLVRIWCEFFDLTRWLEWGRKQNSYEMFCVLERELGDWLYAGKRKKSQISAEMMVRNALGDALGRQLKSCRDTINYGSGVAENKVLSCWELLYAQWKGNEKQSKAIH